MVSFISHILQAKCIKIEKVIVFYVMARYN